MGVREAEKQGFIRKCVREGMAAEAAEAAYREMKEDDSAEEDGDDDGN